jgi:hypothetical protein
VFCVQRFHTVYYSPFTTKTCEKYVDTHWAIINDDTKVYEHIVSSKDLLTKNMIFLYFPIDFNIVQ